jgi:GNAT superfamily N-acetyltransferase
MIRGPVLVVSPLSDHPGFIPVLADAFAREWPAWAERVGRAGVESIFVPGAGGELPIVLVAHAVGRPLGTIALRPYFAEEPMPESPWVRQLYVFPEHRGRGVDRALCDAIEDAARARGFRTLHAATNRIERLLARRGWRVRRRVEHEGEPMAWLAKELQPPSR